MRYSKPLGQFAPACPAHMSEAERKAVAADPLWTNEGQVLWVLERNAGTDDLASVSVIATELGGQPQTVVSALRKLADAGAVAAHTVGGREVWGTAAQVQRMDQARRQADADRAEAAERIHERNRDLESLRCRLESSVAGRGIEVTSLSRMFPKVWDGSRLDQLMVMTDDPEVAAWLLGRLADPG
ncbi:hypothetical protein EP51_39410 (plasmid) [Rhodococcus opacus]|uniref:Uncharacterized protein n=2 Tax=Rhodococcus opacus TaxID=37919 RepID=A0A076EWL6_RHOOP|nr:hypothetical protein EP51_39410 [Rhodococcus opacus]